MYFLVHNFWHGNTDTLVVFIIDSFWFHSFFFLYHRRFEVPRTMKILCHIVDW